MTLKHTARRLLSLLAAVLLLLCPCTAMADWQQDGNGWLYYTDAAGNYLHGLQRVDGKLYFFDQTGRKADELGVDVSQFNYDIDWPTVKQAGIDFAIVRIGGRGWGSGGIYNDSYALQNLTGAREAGLKIGVYFYSTAITESEAVAEAVYTAEVLHGLALDYPVYFDTEWSGDYPEGRSDNLSPNRQSAMARAFCDRMASYGYAVGVYSNQNYYYYAINFPAISCYSIWMASYTENYQNPNFLYGYDVWQFTETGAVSGIDGTADLNAVFLP